MSIQKLDRIKKTIVLLLVVGFVLSVTAVSVNAGTTVGAIGGHGGPGGVGGAAGIGNTHTGNAGADGDTGNNG